MNLIVQLTKDNYGEKMELCIRLTNGETQKIQIENDDKDKVIEILNSYTKATDVEIKSLKYITFIFEDLFWYVAEKFLDEILEKIKENKNRPEEFSNKI